MARIRSIHPDQWTDGAFMQLSPYGRLLVIALRNHADDNGVFAWNPFEIKARIFPMDDIDILQLLEELTKTNHVHPYEVDGKAYGLLRNFHRYQSPRKPQFKLPVPDPIPNGYGLNPDYYTTNTTPGQNQLTPGNGSVPHQYRTSTVEDRIGEDRKGEERGPKGAHPLPDPFIVTEEMKEWRRTEEPSVDEVRETLKFVDYWRGNGKKKIDWTRTWKLWIRRSVDFNGAGARKTTGVPPPKPPTWCKTHPGVALKNGKCSTCEDAK